MSVRYKISVTQHRTGKPLKRIVVTFEDLITGKRTNVITTLGGVAEATVDNIARIIPHTTLEYELINLASSSGPFFCYDYLVSAHYTGTEGEAVSIDQSGHTFKLYSTVKGAVDDANANRQANSQSTSFLICGTGTFEDRYVEAEQINLDPPSAGSYHLFGTGADTTQIDGTMTSGALFNIPTQSSDSQVEFHHIEMRTVEAIALIQGGGSTRITLDNCWLRPNNNGARAIGTGSGVVGWNISNTNFEGTGVGIDSGTLMNVRLTNCYVAMTIGIRMVNATQVHCTNVKFACSSRDVEIGATTGALAFSAGGGCEFNKGIYFTSGAGFSWFDNFVVNGCTFIIGSGETGIDYSGATRESALTEAAAHSITGNTFRGSGTAKGIVGGSASADGPHCATVVGNTFEGFTADNEIVDMDLTGDNEVAHNCTDSGATLYDSHIASGDVNHDLLSATHPDTLASAVSRGSLIVGDATPEYAELALGADHRFLGSDGSDAVYRTVGWDAILSPTGSNDAARIQAAIDAGARRILLLDGSWDVGDSQVTFATGTEILGQSRDGTVLSWGTVNYWQFGLVDGCFVGNFTVNTAPADAGAPVIALSLGRCTAWNIDFGPSSGNGILAEGASQISIISCVFQGLPDSNTGQIEIADPSFLSIQDCSFQGAVSAGAAIYNRHPTFGGEFFPRPNIVITGCYGTTQCGQGWLYDGGAGRESTFTVSGNSIAQAGANAPMAIDISKAIAVIVGNSFVVPPDQATAAAMISVSGGKVMIENNRLDANSARTDIIDITASGGHMISGNLIRGISTNAIHLAGAGDNIVVANNNCPSGDIRVAAGSTGNVIGFNIANAIIADAGLNQVGLNVVGVG